VESAPSFSGIHMKKPELEKILFSAGKAVVIEFWAPWCGPCRAMEPNLEKVAGEFSESVELVRINVDNDVEIARDLKIHAIPTMVAYKEGKELFRKTGSQHLESLRSIFLSASNGIVDVKSSVSPTSRIIRLFSGVGLIAIGLGNGINWLYVLLGALIVFWGVYDRCPIYNSVKTWIKSKFSAPGLENPPVK
jgi:thioredoxin